MSPCSTCENSALGKEVRALRFVAVAARAAMKEAHGPSRALRDMEAALEALQRQSKARDE
jgi:hypothetical protein